MGIVNFSIPKELVKKIVNEVHIENFVETGTFKGETSLWASKYFNKVFTIEIDPEISNATAKTLNYPINIEFIIGNSKDILPNLVKKLKQLTFFWLDGHWCFGAGEEAKLMECPLLDEIEAIKQHQDSIIFIDDARCFLGPLPYPHNSTHWPSIDEIFFILKTNFPSHYTTIHDDVIICVPANVRKIIDDDWVQKFNSRFNRNDQSLSKRELLKKLLKF